MSKNLLNKYVWLVETIYNAKYISFDEINRRWLDNDISEGLEIAKMLTFNGEAEEFFRFVNPSVEGSFGDFQSFTDVVVKPATVDFIKGDVLGIVNGLNKPDVFV